MQTYNGTVVLQFDDNTTGNADSGALVTVRDHNVIVGSGALSTIYDLDENPLLNPLTTDSQGNYSFKVLDGLYDIVIREGQASEFILSGERINSGTSTVESVLLTPIEGQLIYALPAEYADVSKSFLWVDGRKMRSDGVSPDYFIDGSNNLVLTEPVEPNQILEISFTVNTPSITPVALENTIAYFDTIDLALTDAYIKEGDLINVKEAATSDPALLFWDVVLTSSVTPNEWNIRQLSSFPLLSIVLRGTKDFIKRNNFKKMEVIAHRGFEQAAEENTMLAFSIAASRGYSLECDCQPSADGTIWMFHDTSLTNDTNLTGNLYQTTDAVLETAIFDSNVGSSLADQRLSKFEELLKLASKYSLKIYPELKEPDGWNETHVDTFLDLLAAYGYLNQNCVVQTVDNSLLTYIRTKNQDVGIAVLGFQNLATKKADIDEVFALGGASAVWNGDILQSDTSLIPYFFSLGMDVVAWTINDVDQALELKQLGVNGMMSNTLVGGWK